MVSAQMAQPFAISHRSCPLNLTVGFCWDPATPSPTAEKNVLVSRQDPFELAFEILTRLISKHAARRECISSKYFEVKQSQVILIWFGLDTAGLLNKHWSTSGKKEWFEYNPWYFPSCQRLEQGRMPAWPRFSHPGVLVLVRMATQSQTFVSPLHLVVGLLQ